MSFFEEYGAFNCKYLFHYGFMAQSTHKGHVKYGQLIYSCCSWANLYLCTYVSNLELPFLNLWNWENDLRNYFKISTKVMWGLEFKLMTPGSAVQHVTDCSVEPSHCKYGKGFR